MPQKIDIKEIAKRNPKIDVEKIDEWRRFRQRLQERGLLTGSKRTALFRQARRAKFADDPLEDSRLVKLQK
jgi:hypothetical protein